MKKSPFKISDTVRLRDDVLVRHSASVPAHAGYTKEQLKWRATLGKLVGKTGTITRVFEGSRYVNVHFRWEEDGFPTSTLIGIDWAELEGIGNLKLDQFQYEGTVELTDNGRIVLKGGTTLARELELAFGMRHGEPVKLRIVVEKA